jgi:hypothetical protein
VVHRHRVMCRNHLFRLAELEMWIAFEIVIAWVVLSCTLGPALTWALFYGKRRARAQRANLALDESPARQGHEAGRSGRRAA